MKNIIKYILLVCILGLLLSSCSGENGFTPIEWEISSDQSTLTSNGKIYEKYGELPLGVRMENDHFMYVRSVEYFDNIYMSVFAKSMQSSIVHLSDYTYGIVSYVKGDDERLALDSFISGDPSGIRLVNYDNWSRSDIDTDFRDRLDALSSEKITVPVRELIYAPCYQIVYYDSEDILAYTHGAVYEYSGEHYYVNYEKLGNNYFTASGEFAYGRGEIEMYKLDNDLLSLFDEYTANAKYYSEETVYEAVVRQGENGEPDDSALIAKIAIICILLGIICPCIPLVYSLRIILLKKEKDMGAYAIAIASAVWIIAGIINLIISL